LDYKRRRISLYDGTVSTPLLTAIDPELAVCTAQGVRIPARHKAIIPVRLPHRSDPTTGITETLPRTSKAGVSVASALVDCTAGTSFCRVMNPTSRAVVWPAGHAFAYLNLVNVNAVGVNLIDVSDCFTDNPPDLNKQRKGGVRDEEHRGLEPDMPSHADRLSELHRLGVKVGMEGLTPAQADKLSAILYRARDIMAENVTQVPEALVPRHTIPLNDTKPAIQKRFRYDPAKEQKLESLCDDLLNAGII